MFRRRYCVGHNYGAVLFWTLRGARRFRARAFRAGLTPEADVGTWVEIQEAPIYRWDGSRWERADRRGW